MSSKAPTISGSSVVVADSRQISAELGEETVILHLDTGGYYSLRKVAARIWELLRSPVAVSDVGVMLAREYGIDQERCEEDVLELVEDLVKRGLVRVVPADEA